MHIFVIICSLLFTVIMSRQAQAEGKKYIVSIGINQYSDPTWNSLKFASKDAADVHQHFQKWYNGGWLVTDGGEDGRSVQPVRTDDIRTALKRLHDANLNEEDTVIVYVSSHGSVGRRLNPVTRNFELDKVIVTFDTTAENPTATGFTHHELLESFRKLKSRRKALILDSCYSGTGKSKLNARMLSLLARQKAKFFEAPGEDPGEGSVILAASAWGEEAQEYNEGKNGLYTHFLLKGFERGLGRGAEVTLTEAHAFATRAVKNHTQGLQNPTAVIELVGTDPIMVKGEVTQKKPPILYAFDWTAKRVKVLVDGVDKGSMDNGTLEVPEGLRRITLIEPEKQLVLSDRNMILSPGQEYALSSLLAFHPRFSFALVSRYGRWLDNSTQKVLGRDDFNVLGVEAAIYDVAGRFDLYLGLQGASGVQTAFLSESVDVNQEYSLLEAHTQIGKRFKIGVLSDFGDSRDYETFFLARAGVTGAYLERVINADDFSQPKQITARAGWIGAWELQTLLLDPNILFGAGMQTIVLPDFTRRDRMSVRLELGLTLGKIY